jgi:hypothetical protein
MNVEIGAAAALFPEKEYLSGIFVAVQLQEFSAVGKSSCGRFLNAEIFICGKFSLSMEE